MFWFIFAGETVFCTDCSLSIYRHNTGILSRVTLICHPYCAQRQWFLLCRSFKQNHTKWLLWCASSRLPLRSDHRSQDRTGTWPLCHFYVCVMPTHTMGAQSRQRCRSQSYGIVDKYFSKSEILLSLGFDLVCQLVSSSTENQGEGKAFGKYGYCIVIYRYFNSLPLARWRLRHRRVHLKPWVMLLKTVENTCFKSNYIFNPHCHRNAKI